MSGVLCLVASHLSFLVFLSLCSSFFVDYVFSYVQCVLLIYGRCSANVHWYCEYEVAPTLF